jgi:hypothetical protein
MKWLIRTVNAFVEHTGFWLPAVGLLLIGSGLLVTIAHIIGRGR